MYQIQSGALLEIQMVGRLHGQTIRNVFHYLYLNQAAIQDGAAAALEAAQQFKQSLWDDMASQFSNEYTLVYITAQWVKPTRYRLVTMSVGETGTAQTNSLPSTVAVVLSFYAEFAGRRYQARKYFAGIPTTHEQDSKIAPAQLANWETVAADLASGFVTLGTNRTYELTTETAQRYAGSGQDRVVDYVVRDVLRVQRRREVGVGE